MKLKTLAVALTLAATTLSAVAAEKAPTTDKEKLSYSFGAMFGLRVKDMQEDLDTNMLIEGLRTAISGGKLALSEPDMMNQIQKAQEQSMQKMQKKMEELAKVNQEKSTAFLKENATKPDIKTTKSGLQYKVIKEGKGAKPLANSEVVVHYEGKLLDGTVFDSSYSHGQPATFPLNQVIPGWTEALQLMTEGSTYELYIPPELAYGQFGVPNSIEPNSVLNFKVELIKINTPEQGKEQPKK